MEEVIVKKKKKRIVEIDFVRGVLIWFMIVDHFFFDFADLIGRLFKIGPLDPINEFIKIANNYWAWDLRIEVRFIVISLFFLLSGISCYFSRSNLKRGLIITAVGLAISVIFCFYGRYISKKLFGYSDPSTFIIFGAISCFGLSILIFCLIRFIYSLIFKNRKEDFKWVALGLGMICIAMGLMFGVWKIRGGGAYGPEMIQIYFEGDAGKTKQTLMENLFKFIVGLKQPQSADWLPLFPYIGFLFTGYFLGEFIYKDRKSLFKKLPAKPEPGSEIRDIVGYYGIVFPYKGLKGLFSFSGKYSLFFYLLHQVVLVLIIGLVMLAKGYKLNI